MNAIDFKVMGQRSRLLTDVVCKGLLCFALSGLYFDKKQDFTY